MTTVEILKEMAFTATETQRRALEDAISAVSAKGDLISRQKVLNTLDFVDKACIGEERTVEKYKELLTECIKVLPSGSENPQPKMGQWIFDETLDRHYYCSECKSMGVDYWDYCPYCGADMRGENT